MNENIFDKLDFGPFRSLLDNDDITDISYDNGGQIWIRSLTQGSLRVEVEGATPDFVEKLAFQCSNVMGTTFNNAKPFLDAESAELRMNFVHQSIATNGIALVIRKTPAKIRLEKEKLIQEDYFTPAIHDFLIKCVEGHCNIMVAGETGSGKTEFVKYLASHTKTNEKIITIEDTLELHLDKIFPQRDIVSMKTNNVASYTDVLVTCMRQNPKWILLSEVRSAEAVSAVRNSISSGHNILSTIHADKASAIPYRLYSLMETDLDVHQFLTTIYRYIQLGVHIKAFYSKEYGKFHREIDEVAEFYVDDDNVPISRIIYQKVFGQPMMCKPSKHLIEYLENQNIEVNDIIKDLPKELPIHEFTEEDNAGENVENNNEDNNGENNNVEDANVEANDNEVNIETEAKPDNGVVAENAINNNNEQVENNTPVLAPISSEIEANKPLLTPTEGATNTPQITQQNVMTPVIDNQTDKVSEEIAPKEPTPAITATEPVSQPISQPVSQQVPNIQAAQSAAQPVASPVQTQPGLSVNPNISVPLAAPVVTPQTVPQQQMVINAQPTNTATQVPNPTFAGIAKLEE